MTTTKKLKQPAQVPLLEVKDFSLAFRHYGKGWHETELKAVRKFNLTIHKGEIVAVVGASGSGKSLLANAILGILPENALTQGTLNYKGMALSREKQVALRGKEISLIPQSVNALDPLMKTGKQVQAVIKQPEKQAIQETAFRQVGLPKDTQKLYPFELSGGMSRRVLVATAMVSGAELVIADEPTPGLDPEALQETLKHMKQLALDGKGMMFITHDIEVALKIADKVAVFYEGETIEVASVADFTGTGEHLKHPYTKALWNALPQNDFTSGRQSDATQASHLKSSRTVNKHLQIKDISYKYPNKPYIFKQTHLTIQPGEIVGLSGRSGSGKSTMAQIIAGYKTPMTGIIQIGGQPISTKHAHPVQLVWQHPEKVINPRWRLKKMVQETGGLDPALMKTLGIKESWLNRWPSELSGGELQRFCLARALASPNIKFLIADEMTTMLDAITQAQIWRAIIKLVKERHIGVLAISHDHDLLHRVSDRIIHFSDIK